MRLAVLTPLYQDYDEPTKASIEAVQTALPWHFIFLQAENPYIHVARRRLLTAAWETHRQWPLDYVLWLDSDIEFTPHDLQALVEDIQQGKGHLITGLYFDRHGPCSPLVAFGSPNRGYHWALSTEQLHQRYVSVDACGLGFALMSSNLLEDYCRKLPSTQWFDSSKWMLAGMPPDRQISPIGEDIYFCEKARQLGYPVLLDAHVLLRHKGIGIEDWSRTTTHPHTRPWCPARRTTPRLPDTPLRPNGLTRRAVLYVGLACNLKCVFCYHKYEHNRRWRRLESCCAEADHYVRVCQSNAVDITGGEPTLYPDILSLVAHCRNIGLRPSLITHGLELTPEFLVQLYDRGLEDLLVSIHGWGPAHDELVGLPGAHQGQVLLLEQLKQRCFPFRVNCVVCRNNLTDLRLIAHNAANFGAAAINFLNFNPFFHWQQKDPPFQSKLLELVAWLVPTLELCDEIGLEATARYVPFCQLPGHESKCFNFAQLPYDPHEWDPRAFCDRRRWGPGPALPDQFFEEFYDEELCCLVIARQHRASLYALAEPCEKCSLREICDGITVQYLRRFGTGELRSIPGPLIQDPAHFLHDRIKRCNQWTSSGSER